MKKRSTPKGFSDLSWVGSAIKDADKEIKRLKKFEPTGRKKKLLADLKAVELYIGVASPKKKHRAIKSRGRIIAQLRELEK